MNYERALWCVISIAVGILLMLKNKFYRHNSDNMLFPAELKVFLGGFLLCLLGLYGLVAEVIKQFK